MDAVSILLVYLAGLAVACVVLGYTYEPGEPMSGIDAGATLCWPLTVAGLLVSCVLLILFKIGQMMRGPS